VSRFYKRFSRATRADLRAVLTGSPVETVDAIIEALELGVANWRMLEQVRKDDDASDRAIRAWAIRVTRSLERAQDVVRTVPDDAILTFVRPARFHRLLTLGITTAQAEESVRGGRGGRPSRFLLNLNLARALSVHGVRLTKSRSGVAHRVFVIVYAELDLSRAGDVFRAVEQGINLVHSGKHLRVSPRARKVLKLPRKRR
jgi:hypothetical protein